MKTEEMRESLDFAKTKEDLQRWFERDCAPYIKQLEKKIKDLKEELAKR